MCIGFGKCYGYVTTTPWIGQRTGLETWACCLGVAERALGEPVQNAAVVPAQNRKA